MPSILEGDCQNSPVIFFRINSVKDKPKAPAVDILRMNTLRNIKNTFLTPTRLWDSDLYGTTCCNEHCYQNYYSKNMAMNNLSKCTVSKYVLTTIINIQAVKTVGTILISPQINCAC